MGTQIERPVDDKYLLQADTPFGKTQSNTSSICMVGTTLRFWIGFLMHREDIPKFNLNSSEMILTEHARNLKITHIKNLNTLDYEQDAPT